MNYIILFISLIATSCNSQPKNTLPFEHYPIIPVDGASMQASGLTRYKDHFYTVNDESNIIYKLVKKEKHYDAIPVYIANPPAEVLKQKKYKLDYEEIVFCNNHFYITDERDRLIYGFNLNEPTTASVPTTYPYPFKNLHVVKLRREDYLKAYPKSMSFISNFGLEGLACDERSRMLFVGNEKRSKAIFYVSIDKEEIIDVIKYPEEPTLNVFRDDIAGLYFYKDYLYSINRSQELIEKIDPKTKQTVARLPYPSFADEIYKHKFYTSYVKMPEGIVVDEENIYFALDSNGLTPNGYEQALSSIIVIKRPKDF